MLGIALVDPLPVDVRADDPDELDEEDDPLPVLVVTPETVVDEERAGATCTRS